MTDDAALSELQAWMAEVFRRRRALPKDAELTELAKRHVTGNDRLLPVEQLEIYREQFWLRHTSSLIEDFPGVGGILGQDDWQRLIEEYLEACPPVDFSLRDLGKRFPEFVAECEWLPHRELCADMARLEWAYMEAFDAADSEPLDASALGAIPEAAWESARIELSPALRRLSVRYPVADLRRRLKTSGDEHVAVPEPEVQNIVVYRRVRELYDSAVEPGAFALLGALAEGMPLVPACERALAEVPEQAEQIESSIAAWFQGWAELGWIARVVVE